MKTLIFFLIITLMAWGDNDRALYIKKYTSEQKTALIIGNSNYRHFSRLQNSKNDAYDMQKALKSNGFDVLYLQDGSRRDMKKIVRKFTNKLKHGGVGFFYYAGHGVEVDGVNYLIPVNADIPDKNEVEYEALAVNMIIDKMEDSKNRLNVVVLDACRNDPFSRSGGGGLAQINNAKGMYIAFATAPGNVASDGKGRNGLFTKYLIKNINKPNLELNRVFKNVRIAVNDESNGRQLPWTSSSVIGDFYFKIDKKALKRSSNAQEFSHEKKTDKSLLGKWSLEWQGSNATYTGHLKIDRKLSATKYRGRLYLEYKGYQGRRNRVEQDADITISGDNVEVHCSNPSVRSWDPDNFFLVKDNNKMFGYSKDNNGRIGKKIQLWRN